MNGDDGALLRAWADGDARAADLLVARHYERVRRFFDFRLPSDSEDLTQKTFLACVEARESYRGDGPFVGFLFGIARRQFALAVRTRDRDQKLVSFAEAAGPETVTTPTGVIALKEEHRILLRAFESLTDEQKLVVELFYWESLNTRDIANTAGVSVSAVTSRLERARAAMREFVARWAVRPAARENVLSNLDGWARSLVPQRG